jgi:hypothetical protein
MEAILYQHEIRELAQDIEATMDTVAPDPFYEFPSAGWRVDGVAGVREHYRRALPHGGRSNIASKKRVHGVGPNTLFREAWISWDAEDGTRLTGQYMAVLEFDPVTRKIKSERQYSDASLDRFLDPHLGADYGRIPGVTRLNANAKPISREDMLAEAQGGARLE